MNGIINTIKKFITNKNTVTIIGVILGVLVLWGFYTWRINAQLKPAEVPYAKRTLTSKTQITKDDIGYMKVSSETLKNAKVYKRSDVDRELIGKYVNWGITIPKGSMFYLSECVEKSELPDNIFDEIPAGYRIFQLKVDKKTSFFNSIRPHTKIDLEINYTVDSIPHFYTFIKDIEVLAVRDSQSKDIDNSNATAAGLLLFAVSDEYFGYLMSAKELSGVELTPAPRGHSQGEIDIGVEAAIEYIKSRAETQIE